MSVALQLDDEFQELEALGTGELLRNEPLAPRLSVRAGGSADALVRPDSPESLVAALRWTRKAKLPLHVLGGGANTLVGDGGVPGVTVQLPPRLFPEETEALASQLVRLTLGAGAPIARLVVMMKAQGLVGAEFLAGIPGTLGGAVTMNAGTKMGECMSVVDAVEVATADGLRWIPRVEIPVAYRESRLPADSVVTRIRFLLKRGDERAIAASRTQMDEDLAYRKRTQPLSLPNFGSVFRNPKNPHPSVGNPRGEGVLAGTFAGALIEEAGLKGTVVGRAQISSLHANWMVNLGGAQAKDFDQLIALTRETVRQRSGVELHPEVKRVGRFEVEQFHGS